MIEMYDKTMWQQILKQHDGKQNLEKGIENEV